MQNRLYLPAEMCTFSSTHSWGLTHIISHPAARHPSPNTGSCCWIGTHFNTSQPVSVHSLRLVRGCMLCRENERLRTDFGTRLATVRFFLPGALVTEWRTLDPISISNVCRACTFTSSGALGTISSCPLLRSQDDGRVPLLCTDAPCNCQASQPVYGALHSPASTKENTPTTPRLFKGQVTTSGSWHEIVEARVQDCHRLHTVLGLPSGACP